jgi:hypothetical protein
MFWMLQAQRASEHKLQMSENRSNLFSAIRLSRCQMMCLLIFRRASGKLAVYYSEVMIVGTLTPMHSYADVVRSTDGSVASQ